MRIGSNGLAILKRYETGPDGKGFAATPYMCPAGHATVGWGHMLVGNEEFDYPMSEDSAEDLLRQDIRRFEKGVRKHTKHPVSQDQFDALVCFAFNVGLGAYQRSTLLRLLNRGDVTGAAGQFRRWNKAGGKVLRGLSKRRRDEEALFRSGAA